MRSHSKYKAKWPGWREGTGGARAIPRRPPHGSVATRSVRGRVRKCLRGGEVEGRGGGVELGDTRALLARDGGLSLICTSRQCKSDSHTIIILTSSRYQSVHAFATRQRVSWTCLCMHVYATSASVMAQFVWWERQEVEPREKRDEVCDSIAGSAILRVCRRPSASSQFLAH